MAQATAKKSKSKPSSSKPSSHQQQRPSQPLDKQVAATLKRLQTRDPGLKQLLRDAFGYAVFPSVGKAALVIGGAYGRGQVFQRGKLVGYATIGQTTIGVQIGGDTFSEIILFENREALDRFKRGRLAFAANASAVLVKAGAAATADYEKGVAIFAYADGGMLLEAAIGGQKFKFKPVSEQMKSEQQEQRKRGGRNQSESSGASDEESEQKDDDEDSDQGEGFMGRAMQLFKSHPVAFGAIGAGALATVALLAMGTMGSGSDEDDQEDSESDQAEDEMDRGEESDQDEQEEDEDDDNARGDYDEGDQESDQDENEEESDAESSGEQDRDEEDADTEDEDSEEPARERGRRERSHRRNGAWR